MKTGSPPLSVVQAAVFTTIITLFCLTACFAPLDISSPGGDGKPDAGFNTAALNTAIAGAEAERDAVYVSVNGRDVPPEKFWVSPPVKAGLTRAVIHAAGIRGTAVSQA